MKPKTAELDVDFIGGQNPMTKEEEKAISDFIKAQKLLRTTNQNGRKKATHRRTSIA